MSSSWSYLDLYAGCGLGGRGALIETVDSEARAGAGLLLNSR